MKRVNLLLLMLFLLILTSCMLSKKKTNKLLVAARKKQPYDAIIVPGVPHADSGWSNVMMIRVYWSHYLYNTGVTKNVIYSGSAVYTPYVEAKIMGLYGEALGIPKENIFAETKAEHSTENLYYSYKLAKELGFKNIALATDPFQDKMLRSFERKAKIKVDHIPMVIDTLKVMNKVEPKINPEPAYVPTFVSIMERESFWERWRGTRGKKIKFEPEVD